MAVNPYTMNQLYEKGLINYIPTELMMPMPVGNMSMQNPYLNAAEQGGLYQNYGQGGDSFTSSVQIGNNYQTNNGYYAIGSQSNNNIGTTFGFDGTGNQSSAGVSSMFGEKGVGNQSNINQETIHGGFSNVKNDVTQGFNKASAVYSSTPNIVKGMIAAGLILLTTIGMFKFGGKKTGTSFWSKLNPANWFKKTK